MKKPSLRWILTIAMLLNAFSTYAQKSANPLPNEWVVPLESARIGARIESKAKPFRDKKYYKNTQLISLRSVADTQQDGILSFRVPADTNQYQAVATEIIAEDKRNYVWNGDMIDVPGAITIVSTKGKINAHMTLNGKEYEIRPLEDNVYAMVERTEWDTDADECSDLKVAEGAKAAEDESLTNGRKTSCTPRVVRVLVLSTPAARARNADIAGLANLAIAQFNQAQTNSAVNGRLNLVLAGVKGWNLAESIPRDDVAELARNSVVRDRRAAANADLVVCFVAGADYGGTRGRVDAIGPSFNDAFAVVRVDFATNGYTFVHEVGHLYGAQHQDCDAWDVDGCIRGTATSYDHGYNFVAPRFLTDIKCGTLMHTLRDGYIRIPYFSNPAVSYAGIRTGIAGRYDNAREIERTDFTIANFDRNGDVSASIDGPTRINLYTNYNWEAVYSCGSNHTFRWETSEDGFNYYSAGSQERLNRSQYSAPSNGRLYIRLTVTAGGKTTQAVKTVYVNGSNARRGIAQSSDTISWGEVVDDAVADGILLESIYPNPAAEHSQVSFYLPDRQTITLDMVDASGKLMQNVAGGDFEAGSYEFEVDHHSLPMGLYFYRLTAGEAQLTKRLIIKKK